MEYHTVHAVDFCLELVTIMFELLILIKYLLSIMIYVNVSKTNFQWIKKKKKKIEIENWNYLNKINKWQILTWLW